MPSLTSAELADRLALDYRSTIGLTSSALGEIQAFTSDANLRAGRRATSGEGESGRARLYVVEYAFPILVGPGPTTPHARVHINLLEGGNYPYSEPGVTVISRPLPWSPHVKPSNGIVCLGEGWKAAQGSMLLCHLVRHVMRLFNYDEPERTPEYVGWNGAAVRYWRSTLGCRPLHPELPYPPLPTEVTHGVEDGSSAFGAAAEDEDGFRVPNAVVSSAFRAQDATGFRPL